MGKLVVSEFVTLDGVFEDPGGAEGFKFGGWSFKFARGPKGDKFKLDELTASSSLLLGRTTYQDFAAAWPTIKDEAGFADKMNSMPKYVVSSSLQKADWTNSTIIKGNVAAEITELKQSLEQDLLIFGSGELVRDLMQHGLIDEYRLMVYPVVLGSGKRLFEGASKTSLKLIDQVALGDGIVLLTYKSTKKGTA